MKSDQNHQGYLRHQFNNSLQVVVANVEILKFHLSHNDVEAARQTTDKLDSSLREILANIKQTKRRAAA